MTYKVLYNGPEDAALSRFRHGFPRDWKLYSRDTNHSILPSIESLSPHAILHPIEPSHPSSFQQLKNLLILHHIPPVIVVANHLTAAQALCCQRAGAADCLSGSVRGDVIAVCLKRLFPQCMPEQIEPCIIGHSPCIEQIRERIRLFAPYNFPVLITGETGSGKELAARSLHHHSQRPTKAFVAVNCARFTKDIAFSQLFGSKPGAFTGAEDQKGFFEEADGGTLFLDEIGELSEECQAALLRIIDDGIVRRLGSITTTKHVNVRIVAATNRSQEMLRPDLYFRISQLILQMPPLRERREDIPLLATNYLTKIHPQSSWTISGQALENLCQRPWIGNVRELQTVLKRASIFALNQRITAESLQETLQPSFSI